MASVLSRATVLLRAKSYIGSGNWLDESGNGHDATPQGDPVHNGDHWTLDGIGDYFTITDHADLDFAAGDDFTIMVRFRGVPINTGAQSLLVAKEGISALAGYNFGWASNDERLAGRIQDGATASQDLSATLEPRDGEIIVGAMVRNTTDDDIEVFIDGTGTGTPATDTTTASLANVQPLAIGGDTDGTDLYTGDIFDFVLWREALSDADAAAATNEVASNARLLRLGAA